jgi:enoyl-CoA hydratase/carnithine racemase
MLADHPGVRVSRVGDHVAELVLDRPEAMNAVSTQQARSLAVATTALAADRSVRAVLVTSSSPKAFCVGADLKERSSFTEADLRAQRPVARSAYRGFLDLPVPAIAVVAGYALGGGFEIALSCDLIVAARDARIGIPEAKRGLVAAAGALIRLPKRIPYHVAMELALTGDPISAERAHELGIVNRVTEPGGAVDAALELAGQIARNGPLALAASKKIVASALDWDEAEAWQKQGELTGPVFASEDAREGAVAFAEKRDPVWKGK